jgi:hypothetical protein
LSILEMHLWASGFLQTESMRFPSTSFSFPPEHQLSPTSPHKLHIKITRSHSKPTEFSLTPCRVIDLGSRKFSFVFMLSKSFDVLSSVIIVFLKCW